MSEQRIKIEKGIPVPSSIAYKKLPFPFVDMDVGDSFAIPLSDEQVKAGGALRNVASHTIREQCRRFRKRPGNADKKFTVREIKEEGIVRCWRTA